MDLRPLHPIAARQRDLLTAADLRRGGFPDGAIDSAVRRGHLRVVHPGVYALGVHRDREDLWLAGVLACGRGTGLSHGGAMAHFGFGRERLRVVEVSSARSRVGPAGVLVHRPRKPVPTIMWRGIPTTPVLRTLVDLADVLSFDALLTVAMEADHQRLADLRQLEPIPGRRGVAKVERLLQYTAEGTRSQLEALARERFHGLPAFEANVRIHGRLLDCVWREHRVALECDSYAHHRQRRKFESDRRVPLELELHGWHVVRVTWRQLRYEPELVVAAVTSALSRAGWAGSPFT